MADKSKTIKTATDTELEELIRRLRKENEAQDLIVNLKRKSNQYGFIPYDNPEVSTEIPINDLYHFGIPGMRWGRRKGRATLTTTKETSEDYKQAKSLKKKSISEMTNKDLEVLTRRMQLEKQYKDLKKMDLEKGQSVIKDIVKTGKTLSELYNLVNSPAGKAARSAIAKKTVK